MKNVRVHVLFFVVLVGTAQNAAYGMNREAFSSVVSAGVDLVRNAPVVVVAAGAFALSLLSDRCRRGQARVVQSLPPCAVTSISSNSEANVDTGAGALGGDTNVVGGVSPLLLPANSVVDGATRAGRSGSLLSKSSAAADDTGAGALGGGANAGGDVPPLSLPASSVVAGAAHASGASIPQAQRPNSRLSSSSLFNRDAAAADAGAGAFRVVTPPVLYVSSVNAAADAGAVALGGGANAVVVNTQNSAEAQSNNKLLVAAVVAGAAYWKRAELQRMYARVRDYLAGNFGKEAVDAEAQELTKEK